jgi:hypothetical protein
MISTDMKFRVNNGDGHRDNESIYQFIQFLIAQAPKYMKS